VARLMRVDPAIANKDLDIATFRTLFPLGSHQRVSLIDGERVFFGMVTVADAYTEGRDAKAPVTSIADLTAGALTPEMSIKEAMKTFDRTELDTLAVLDSLESRRLMGTLKESYATRRYAEEMEKAQEMAL
jgi:CIC family chloride channel protein